MSVGHLGQIFGPRQRDARPGVRATGGGGRWKSGSMRGCKGGFNPSSVDGRIRQVQQRTLLVHRDRLRYTVCMLAIAVCNHGYARNHWTFT